MLHITCCNLAITIRKAFLQYHGHGPSSLSSDGSSAIGSIVCGPCSVKIVLVLSHTYCVSMIDSSKLIIVVSFQVEVSKCYLTRQIL